MVIDMSEEIELCNKITKQLKFDEYKETLNLEEEQLRTIMECLNPNYIRSTEGRLFFEGKGNSYFTYGNDHILKIDKKNPFIINSLNKKEYWISEHFKKYRPDLYCWINPVVYSIFDSKVIWQQKCEPITNIRDIPKKIPYIFRNADVSDFVWKNGLAVLNNYSFIDEKELELKNDELNTKFIERDVMNKYMSHDHKINKKILENVIKNSPPHII
ncbi:MAG: hypothetical protein IJ772_04975 [Bacilli bacterium]|nr:hypothetical protein [Bacilli bacterium]